MRVEPNSVLAELLSGEPYANAETDRQRFKQALRAQAEHHFHTCEPFRRLCQSQNITDFSNVEPADFPFVTTKLFKRKGAALRSVPEDTLKFTLSSSGTSGAPSSVLIDALTAKRQVKAMSAVMANFLGKKRRPFLFFDINPKKYSPAELGARAAAIIGYLNFASSAEYFLTPMAGRKLAFERAAFEAALRRYSASATSAEEAPVLFGFTYVLFEHVIDALHQEGVRFSLPAHTAVVHIGGWKKLAALKIGKSAFNQKASDVFGISPSRIIDVYGFTEQMGLNYPDCEAGVKHVPVFADVVVRDSQTFEAVPDGKEGLLQFLSPVPHSYPGISVLTDDVGAITGRGLCRCGRAGTTFAVSGRLSANEVRGCGDVMSEVVIAGGKQTRRPATSSEKIEHYLCQNGRIEPIDDVRPVLAQLRQQQEWLARVPSEALMAFFEKVAARWSTNPAFAVYQKAGIASLKDWCKAMNLRALANRSLQGSHTYLDHFGVVEDSLKERAMAVPRGLAVHWFSGNAPVIGLFVLLQSMLAKNVNVVKTPANFKAFIPRMLEEFDDVFVSLPSGYTLKGSDLLRTLAVIYMPKEHPAGEILSVEADVRVAWGGQEAIESISAFPKKYDTEDIFFGPKLSFMAIGKEFLADTVEFKKLVRHAAADCSVFDQYACSSPHTIFVEQGGTITSKEFAQRLSAEMDNTLKRIPKGDISAETAFEILSRRIEYSMFYEHWDSAGTGWTVLYDEKPGLATPSYARVVTVRPVANIMESLPCVDKGIQTVGLALKGKRRLDYAEAAAYRGVQRLPDIGRMTFFDTPWDGVFPLARLVRWVKLGGPTH